MTDLTDLDLGRLLVFATLHGGHLPDLPHGVYSTYDRLAKAGLVSLTGMQSHAGDVGATITDRGRTVADAMLARGRELCETKS